MNTLTISRTIVITIITMLTTACVAIMGQYEEPKHTIVRTQDDNIELRAYDPVIAATVTVGGERKEAINAGFRLLAGYIFGDNISQQKIAMTTPVTQQASEKIAMTTPVTQQATTTGRDTWQVQFIMPSSYTLETLPKPKNDQVKLLPVPARHFAVIRFSGFSSESNIAKHRALIESYVREQKLKPLAEPVLAFYDPPWTLPFLRRNEVMIEVKP